MRVTRICPLGMSLANRRAASAIAARTQRIRIGLAVVLLPLGHPIHIAEDIATLDHISQGRVEFGVAPVSCRAHQRIARR